MKRVLVALADGFEEIEAVTPLDLLRRAGIEVVVAGVGSLNVTSRRGLKVTCDALLEKGDRNWDALILPGGLPGADNLAASAEVRELLQWGLGQERLVGAICAAPVVVLGALGHLKGRRYTGYPGMAAHDSGGVESAGAVVIDGPLITSRGVGTAGAFSLALIAALVGQETADRIARETLLLLD